MLGLIGGMSWESTAVYYQMLNRLTRDRLGGQHSARLVIWSIDFAPMAALQAAGDWDAATDIMIDAARRLEAAGAEAILICANTMHLMAEPVAAAIRKPLIHVADVTAEAIVGAGVSRPLLLATRYTMEQGFYLERLARHGVSAVIPPPEAREALHRIIFDELVQGRFEAASRAEIIDIVSRATDDEAIDGVILGCTEFGLLISADDLSLPVFDTTELHARAAVDFALATGGL